MSRTRYWIVQTALFVVLGWGTLSGEAQETRRGNPGMQVQSSITAIVSYDGRNANGSLLQFRHLGTGFLATESGWLITLKHVLAARPQDTAFSILAFANPSKMTPLPVVEGPIYPAGAEGESDLCLVKIGRKPSQLKPVDFGFEVRTARDGSVELDSHVLPCDELGLYATLLGDAAIGPTAPNVVHRYARKGIVSSITESGNGDQFYFLDVVGFSGYSGGPVFRWSTGGVFGIVTTLEARQQQFEQDGGDENQFKTYLMHGIRAVDIRMCVERLIARGETLRFIDPLTGERFQYSMQHGKQSVTE